MAGYNPYLSQQQRIQQMMAQAAQNAYNPAQDPAYAAAQAQENAQYQAGRNVGAFVGTPDQQRSRAALLAANPNQYLTTNPASGTAMLNSRGFATPAMQAAQAAEIASAHPTADQRAAFSASMQVQPGQQQAARTAAPPGGGAQPVNLGASFDTYATPQQQAQRASMQAQQLAAQQSPAPQGQRQQLPNYAPAAPRQIAPPSTPAGYGQYVQQQRIPGYRTGTVPGRPNVDSRGRIDRTTLAVLHPGEIVLNRQQAAQLQRNQFAGGTLAYGRVQQPQPPAGFGQYVQQPASAAGNNPAPAAPVGRGYGVVGAPIRNPNVGAGTPGYTGPSAGGSNWWQGLTNGMSSQQPTHGSAIDASVASPGLGNQWGFSPVNGTAYGPGGSGTNRYGPQLVSGGYSQLQPTTASNLQQPPATASPGRVVTSGITPSQPRDWSGSTFTPSVIPRPGSGGGGGPAVGGNAYGTVATPGAGQYMVGGQAVSSYPTGYQPPAAGSTGANLIPQGGGMVSPIYNGSIQQQVQQAQDAANANNNTRYGQLLDTAQSGIGQDLGMLGNTYDNLFNQSANAQGDYQNALTGLGDQLSSAYSQQGQDLQGMAGQNAGSEADLRTQQMQQYLDQLNQTQSGVQGLAQQGQQQAQDYAGQMAQSLGARAGQNATDQVGAYQDLLGQMQGLAGSNQDAYGALLGQIGGGLNSQLAGARSDEMGLAQQGYGGLSSMIGQQGQQAQNYLGNAYGALGQQAQGMQNQQMGFLDQQQQNQLNSINSMNNSDYQANADLAQQQLGTIGQNMTDRGLGNTTVDASLNADVNDRLAQNNALLSNQRLQQQLGVQQQYAGMANSALGQTNNQMLNLGQSGANLGFGALQNTQQGLQNAQQNLTNSQLGTAQQLNQLGYSTAADLGQAALGNQNQWAQTGYNTAGQLGQAGINAMNQGNQQALDLANQWGQAGFGALNQGNQQQQNIANQYGMSGLNALGQGQQDIFGTTGNWNRAGYGAAQNAGSGAINAQQQLGTMGAQGVQNYGQQNLNLLNQYGQQQLGVNDAGRNAIMSTIQNRTDQQPDMSSIWNLMMQPGASGNSGSYMTGGGYRPSQSQRGNGGGMGMNRGGAIGQAQNWAGQPNGMNGFGGGGNGGNAGNVGGGGGGGGQSGAGGGSGYDYPQAGNPTQQSNDAGYYSDYGSGYDYPQAGNPTQQSNDAGYYSDYDPETAYYQSLFGY